MSEISLTVGESTHLQRGLFRSARLTYAGMISEDVFSIAITITQGYNSMAYNLHFPSRQYELVLMDRRITILHVSPQQIRFRYES